MQELQAAGQIIIMNGTPLPPPVLRWQSEAHKPGNYDMEVDISRFSAAECALMIRERLLHGPAGTAFERLAKGGV